jgi:hypothetical protein
MIAVDTSALMAVVLDEPAAEACSTALSEAAAIIVSAGTFGGSPDRRRSPQCWSGHGTVDPGAWL